MAGLGLYLATAGAPLSLFEASLLFGALSALDSNRCVPLRGSISRFHPLNV